MILAGRVGVKESTGVAALPSLIAAGGGLRGSVGGCVAALLVLVFVLDPLVDLLTMHRYFLGCVHPDPDLVARARFRRVLTNCIQRYT